MRRILGTRRFSAPLTPAMLMLMAHATWGLVPSPASGQSVAPEGRGCASTGGHEDGFLDSASQAVPTERSGGASSQARDHDGAPRQARRDGRAVCAHGCGLAS